MRKGYPLRATQKLHHHLAYPLKEGKEEEEDDEEEDEKAHIFIFSPREKKDDHIRQVELCGSRSALALLYRELSCIQQVYTVSVWWVASSHFTTFFSLSSRSVDTCNHAVFWLSKIFPNGILSRSRLQSAGRLHLLLIRHCGSILTHADSRSEDG